MSARPVPKSLVAVLLLGLAAASLSCGRKAEVVAPPLTLAGIDAESLWKRISVESPWEDWASWPGHEGVREGQAPHGPNHRIFVNKTLLSSLPSASRRAPPGAIIVKENMDADRKVTAITVMAKVEGYDPPNGDWFWARYDLAGKAGVSGKAAGCIACHAGMKDNDYVIVRRLDRP